MAIIKNGQVGNFNGKIGEVVVSQWRDITVGRSTPKVSTKPATPAQLDQRSQFALVNAFYGNVAQYIALGHEGENKGATPINKAVRYGLANAITGKYPNYALDYSKLPISGFGVKKDLDGGYTTSVRALPQAELEVSWLQMDPPVNKITKETDRATFVFFSPVMGKFVTHDGTALRGALKQTILFPRPFVGALMHGWMFFLSEDEKNVSSSDYLGTFTLIV